METIAIIDYGAGNLLSIQNMLKRLGVNSAVCSDADTLNKYTKMILPGVGNFDYGMRMLKERELDSVIKEKIYGGKTTILGICLGMQLLTNYSEEGCEEGLGLIDAETVRFEHLNELRVPHMGWNTVNKGIENGFSRPIMDGDRFYFVHSYYVRARKENVMFTTHYGIDFASGICAKNVFGVQFHPEKSHRYGLKLLESFARL